MESITPYYTLAVGAMFKNESLILREWIEHYLLRGVNHFYLINDNSTDEFEPVLEPYINRGLVTLFHADVSYYLGRQRDMYNTFLLPKVKNREMKWFLIVDIDEYVWSPKTRHLPTVLQEYHHEGQVQVEQTLFGSNGYLTQPASIVSSFTKRSAKLIEGGYKYFINTSFSFTSLNIHHATFEHKQDEINSFKMSTHDWFRMNHYSCQSKWYWDTIKCTRGDGDHYRVRKPDEFILVDCNDVQDTFLRDQNNGYVMAL